MTTSTDAAPRASARQQILAFFDGRPGEHSTGEISTHVNAPQNTIYKTLSDMVARGELVRVSLGQYCLYGDPAAPAAPPAAAPEAAADDAAAPAAPPTPGATEWAIWDTGELLVRVDGQTVLVSAGDTRRLAAFLARCVGDDA